MNARFDEYTVSVNILDSYYRKLRNSLSCDVAIVGAGPSGLYAAGLLSARGRRVAVVESKLAPGGGIWGGGMGMNEIVIQPEAVHVLEDLGMKAEKSGDVYVTDACLLAAKLTATAIERGAVLLNLLTAEDVCVKDGRVTGVVANRTGISGRYHVDPVMFTARAVLDATGHDAMLVNYLNKHGYRIDTPSGTFEGEGAMNVVEGENFVVERTGEVFPGLFLAGMAVCATFNGPRMGPIFGGMLLSGERAAGQIEAALAEA